MASSLVTADKPARLYQHYSCPSKLFPYLLVPNQAYFSLVSYRLVPYCSKAVRTHLGLVGFNAVIDGSQSHGQNATGERNVGRGTLNELGGDR